MDEELVLEPEEMWQVLRNMIMMTGETVADVSVIPNKLFMSRLAEALKDQARGVNSLLLVMMEMDATDE